MMSEDSPRLAARNESRSRQALHDEITALRARIAELERNRAAPVAPDNRTLFAILEALPDIVFILDAQGTYRHIFTGRSNLLAAPEQSLLGRSIHDALPADAAAGIQAIIDTTLSSQNEQTVEYPLDVESGTRWFHGTVVPIELGADPLVLWVARDVTEQREAEAKTRQAQLAIERSSLQKKFFANMSHELRTPINGVIGFLELLSRSQLSDAQAEHVDHIRTCAQSLLTIINDLLNFSKHESDHIVLRREVFDLRTAVRRTVRVFQAQQRSPRVRVTLTADAALPDQLEGDRARIEQILINLINNAIKFTSEGEIAVRVYRDGAPEPPGEACMVCIEVADTGIGIPAAALDTIFDPFVQADNTYLQEYSGTGLGLAIVKQLAELMNGHVEVTSVEGSGSTFSVRLPLAPAPAERGQTTHGQSTRAESPAQLSAPRPPSEPAEPTDSPSLGLHVLVAEDDVIGQKLIGQFLAMLGCTVDVVGDGRRAVEAALSGRYDLIMMDCQMPVANGYQATREIRRRQRDPEPDHKVPIIALTAHAMDGDRETCLAAGMDDYLTKPIRITELRRMLHKWTAAGQTADS